jgi:hypothetical protein
VAVAEPLPEPLAKLVEDLIQRGYRVASDETGAGWRHVELHARGGGQDRAVRLRRDRGAWGVVISLGDEWFGTYDVLRAIDGADYAARAESYDERRATTLEVVYRLPDDQGELARIRERLAEYHREYWARFTKPTEP